MLFIIFFKELNICQHRSQSFVLLFFNYLYYSVVDRCRDSVFFAPFTYDSVDSVYFARLAFLKILEHRRHDPEVFLHGYRHQYLCKLLLNLVVVVEQLRNVLSLDRSEFDPARACYIYAFLHASDRNFRCRLPSCNITESAADDCTEA